MPSTHPLVCVSICESDWPSLARAARDASKQDRLLEIRLDCFTAEVLKNLDPLRELLVTCSHPTIVTFRAADEGGKCDADYETRLRFWRSEGLQLPSTFVDLELDIAEQLSREARSVDWSRVICSYHNHHEIPRNLDRVFDQLLASPAVVLKLHCASMMQLIVCSYLICWSGESDTDAKLSLLRWGPAALQLGFLDQRAVLF